MSRKRRLSRCHQIGSVDCVAILDHTQIFSHEKLAAALPEFSPQVPVTESVAENIAWMDKHNLIPDSDADDLEDQVIEAVRNLPRIR